MERNEIVKKVNEILAEEYEVDESTIENEANIREVLPIDSLSIVDLVALVQSEYNVTIPMTELPKLITFNDLYEYIYTHLPADTTA
jgi:acyl carrier protein